MTRHDLIVIGASAGGVETIKKLVTQFTPDLPASVLIVQHTAPHTHALFGDILDAAGPLKAATAEDGEEIVHGRIYVAPPDQHMLVHDGRILLSHGPRENRVRPSIDPLFRSAGVFYGPRTVGVVLSGLQDDGAVGLVAIKRCGGVGIIQDPAEAAYNEMPLAALKQDHPDYSLPIAEIGNLLNRLARETSKAPSPVPEDIMTEVKLTERVSGNVSLEDMPGEATSFICPDCGGPLWELKTGELAHYRCLTGHSYTRDLLMRQKTEEIERVLWEAVRSFEERAIFLNRMAKEGRERGNVKSASGYEEKAGHAKENARILKDFMMSRLP